MNEQQMIDHILEKYQEWTEAYGIDPYELATHVLAKELIAEREKAEIHSYVEHAR
jgi:hypothetical protein